jgi:hypothetical protein
LTRINCTVDWHRADATGMMADCLCDRLRIS